MKVYLAGPYTIGDPVINVRNMILVAEEVRAKGHLPYIPLLNHLWHLASPHEYEYWMNMDLEWIKVCDAILRLPGESKGADLETEYARDVGIPVFYTTDQLHTRS